MKRLRWLLVSILGLLCFSACGGGVSPTSPDPTTCVVRIYENIDEAGTVTGAGEYAIGESVLLKATTKYGYLFDGWYDADGNKLSGNKTFTLTAEGESISIYARWKEDPDPGWGSII